MRKFTCFLVAMTLIMSSFLAIVPLALRTEAATKQPYCRIAYDSSVGCTTTKYYTYGDDGVAYQDNQRLVKFYNGIILLGTANTVITSTQKLGTNTSWSTDSNYLWWIDADGSPSYRKWGESSNIKLTGNAISLGLNSDSMVETVSYADGSTKNVKDLVLVPAADSSSSKPADSSSAQNSSSSSKPADSSSTKPVESSSATPVESSSTKPAESSSASSADNSSDKIADSSSTQSGGTTINIGEGGTYIAGDQNNNNTTTTNNNTSTTNNNYGGNTTQPYVINKRGNSKYTMSNGQTHTLKVTNKNLYFDGKKIAKKVKNNAYLGFNGSFLYYIKGSKEYRANISSPKKATVVKKKVKKLTYSSSNGFVTGAK